MSFTRKADMAGSKRTTILTSWGMPGLKSSNGFAALRTEVRMPRANRKIWQRVFRQMVGDALLTIGIPKD